MLDHKALIQSLDTSILFQGIDGEEVERIVAAGQWKTVEPGEYIYQQGDDHRHFYLVASGAVELTLNVEGGGQHLVGHIGPGGHFGETSLLTGNCNSLNARVLNRATLLCFDEQTFRSVLLANTTMQHQLNVALAKRLRISFHDHADLLAKRTHQPAASSRNLDPTFFSESPVLPTSSDKQPLLFEPGRPSTTAADPLCTLCRPPFPRRTLARPPPRHPPAGALLPAALQSAVRQTDHQRRRSDHGPFHQLSLARQSAELSGVLQRAVLLGENHGSLNPQIILGLPKVEGKWEFNLLQFPRLRRFLASRLFPLVPRLVVGLIFLLVVIALLAGPDNPEDNIGLTLSWIVGWPLLVFSFFFLARTWCSICGLAVPGWLAQLALKPKRPTPSWIRRHSGWIMTVFCILLFWIETTWNAYSSPQLTAWIILSITLGSLFFSIFYQRRVWCRYLCPLGAINALFSMPAIIELRANSQMCANRCTSHLCYHGDQEQGGCPMFRHPFLVDNNRDCILCGQCIKTCRYDSIHLNLRLAPQELWNQESPRLADSVLVVCLAAIVFPFVLAQQDRDFLPRLQLLASQAGLPDSLPLTSAALFLALILFYLSGYLGVSAIIAKMSGGSGKLLRQPSATA
jgi:polyferredoxin/CRP-like cAMP-binding protein